MTVSLFLQCAFSSIHLIEYYVSAWSLCSYTLEVTDKRIPPSFILHTGIYHLFVMASGKPLDCP